ncbi:hypothetical protein RHGRI_020993 [Rhododendron griersonianum]|uniref:Hexosyltransferase n=1 Tax=Rhododendron griersonianum TaxID=479676 RepID=A0AAV6JJV3_9ERIC|nr:hypothetical protein RHGRI_020993 [Rhododendron griersonianum]
MDISSPYREGLPTTTKADRRWKSKPLPTSSKPSILLAFFSCVAWLYIAGRLWQDAENRNLLANLLKKNAEQRPKVLTVEDKLMDLGCKDLERRIVEAEMELTLAKSQGYLQNKLQQSGSSSGKRLLAVIGVYTGFGSRLKRNVFRGSSMPKGDALRKLEERGVVMRFVIGRSANRGDSLDRIIDEENQLTKDFLILEGHEEAQEELPKKAKFFFSTAIQNWDADFYVKVDDNIDLGLEGVIELLESRRGQDSAYIGCMKSGEVITEEGKPWYEPEWWKFGDEKSQADNSRKGACKEKVLFALCFRLKENTRGITNGCPLPEFICNMEPFPNCEAKEAMPWNMVRGPKELIPRIFLTVNPSGIPSCRSRVLIIRRNGPLDLYLEGLGRNMVEVGINQIPQPPSSGLVSHSY